MQRLEMCPIRILLGLGLLFPVNGEFLLARARFSKGVQFNKMIKHLNQVFIQCSGKKLLIKSLLTIALDFN